MCTKRRYTAWEGTFLERIVLILLDAIRFPKQCTQAQRPIRTHDRQKLASSTAALVRLPHQTPNAISVPILLSQEPTYDLYSRVSSGTAWHNGMVDDGNRSVLQNWEGLTEDCVRLAIYSTTGN
jgi:hypothetical protein